MSIHQFKESQIVEFRGMVYRFFRHPLDGKEVFKAVYPFWARGQEINLTQEGIVTLEESTQKLLNEMILSAELERKKLLDAEARIQQLRESAGHHGALARY